MQLSVAPYVGAWIETKMQEEEMETCQVAPYVGAWIETKFEEKMIVGYLGRTLRGCVD